jgi:hypothetical protein
MTLSTPSTPSTPNDLTWKNTILDELVCCHIYTSEHEDNPRKALQDAINWNIQAALDPQVSDGAQALLNKGRKLYLGFAFFTFIVGVLIGYVV